MAFRLDVDASIGKNVRHVARHRLSLALDELSHLDRSQIDLPQIDMADPAAIEKSVHSARKRCKEVRALARLVKSSIGQDFDEFDRSVRRAATAVSEIRDAHVVLQTFDRLVVASDDSADVAQLERVRAELQRDADRATSELQHGAPGVRDAVALLETARDGVSSWKVRRGIETLADGVEATFKRGRRAMRRAGRSPSDAQVHEWRKAVKHLWYDIRLLENASPSMLAPLADVLDELAETLGDHHDLAVLVERVENDPSRFGGSVPVGRVVALARERQLELWGRASRIGATVYAEPPSAFRRRIEKYWELTTERGPETVTGDGDEDTTAPAVDDRAPDTPGHGVPGTEHTVERERKFLVAVPPDRLVDGTAVRQGYLADDGAVTVRLRHTTSSGGSVDGGRQEYTLTVKGGQGAVRTEIECPIGAAQFAAAWPYTGERRVRKTRYRIPFDGPCHRTRPVP